MLSPVNRGKNILEEASKSVNEKLSDYCEAERQPSLYKVHHQFFRDGNGKGIECEPRVIAVGPYHHGKQGLKMMEEHKLRYLKSPLLRKNEAVDRYISAAAEMEEEARSYYAEELSLGAAEFVEMLVLDGCFIIELVIKFQSRGSCASDPIFKMEWILELLKYDLILFENQFPFFVLCKLFDLIDEEPNQHGKLIGLLLSFLEIEELHHAKGHRNVKPEEVRHLLHLTHATLRPSSPAFVELNPCPDLREYLLIPSATELRDANITFSKSQASGQPFEVHFDNGVLTMPTLPIGDDAYSFFRNLIFYEQYFPEDQPTYVTDYVLLLDCLVNTGRDVEILSRCGIIESLIGDNQVAADIINHLTYNVPVFQKNFIYGDTFSRINAHYKRRWNRAAAALNRDYFNTPWAYVSFLAALLLLLLTLAQTIFSALQAL